MSTAEVLPKCDSQKNNGSNGISAIATEHNQDSKVQALLDENKLLRKQKLELEDTLGKIMNSRSWRITSFFRRIGMWLRKFFPLFRFTKFQFKLTPGRNVTFENGKYRVNGISPTIFLNSQRARNPRGWVKLKAHFESQRSPLFFLIYFGKNGDYNPVNRVWLTFGMQAENSFCFRVPEWTTEIRLDPFDTDFSFEVRKLEMQELGKLQVVWQIFSRHLGSAFTHPQMFLKKLKKAWAVFKEGGFAALRVRLFAEDYTSNYQEWVRKYDTLSDSDRNAIKSHIEKLEYKPLISIVMPVYNVPERWLLAAVDSVKKQLYTNWQLCIADDASTEPHVRTVLENLSSNDKRIKIVFRETNGHISAASNSALELATGEFVALLDNDDELCEHALYMLAVALNENRSAGLIYSDEDKVTSYGMRFNPYFKPDWNPDLLLQQNYICHLVAYRASIVREIGGFRSGLDGAQDWDLTLRVSEKLAEKDIVHIPHVLYHWRVIEGSTAQSTSHKPYVMKAQAHAVEEHLSRLGENFKSVDIREDISHLRVKFPVPSPEPKVAIIIPTKDQVQFLRRCVDSIISRTIYKNYQIIVVDNNSVLPETTQYFASLAGDIRIKIQRDERPFNFSQINNSAVKLASDCEILAFLNNDLEVINEDWLSEMVSQLMRPGVGACGARLYFPNDLLQHAGVVIGIGGVAGHSHKGQQRENPGYFNRAILTQDVSAVTAACMLIRKSVFEEVNGFDEEKLAVAFNDVDLSLKVRKAGYRIVYCSYAELYHYESVSRGFEDTPQKFMRFEQEIDVMKKRWGKALEYDPYYNPNLTILTEDYSFSFPPRAIKPWKQV